MKTSSLSTLMVAKSIYNEAKYLVNSGDKYSCTAGLILLQDFVELVVLAALDELDVDEQRSLESKSFDELIGELKRQGVKLVKTGTIKALNKQRVISKHYGQLAEPASVINYFNTAVTFVDALLNHVVGCDLQQILLTDVLKDGIEKDTVKKAILLAQTDDYLAALIELRKAFFESYEFEYSIYSWKDHNNNQPSLLGLYRLNNKGGMKAYYWTKNKQWIDENIKKPTDYIQINHEQLKIDCMEWGVSTVNIENFRRLTPEVVKTDVGSWHYAYDSNFVANEANVENFNYCLDLLLDFLLKKQEFDCSKKWPKREKYIPTPPIYIGKPIYEKPSKLSNIIHIVQNGYYYAVDKFVTGFDVNENYIYVHLYVDNGGNYENHVWGYLLND